MKVDGTEYEINHENTWGQRDRCWASLGGERWQGWVPPSTSTGNVSPRRAGRIHWHSHIQFEDIGFWWWMDEFIGEPRLGGTLADNRGGHFDGAITWPVNEQREQIRLVDFADLHIEAQSGTTKFQSASITLIDEYGEEYPLEFEIISPNATRHIRGEGYGSPTFLGGFQGDWHEEYDKYDLSNFESYKNFSGAIWDGEHAVNAIYGNRLGMGHMEMSGIPPLPQWGYI